MKYLGTVKKKKARENLFSALSISYIVIFILSFVVGITIIMMSQKQTRDGLYDYNSVLVNKMQESIESIYGNVCDFSYSLERDDRMINLIRRGDLSTTSYDQLMPAMNYINDYRRRNMEYIHDVFVHCANSDIIIGSSVHKTEDFYNSFLKYEGYTYSQWREKFLDKKQYNRFYPVNKIEKSPEGIRVITFANTLYANNVAVGTVIVQVDAESLVNTVFVEEVEKGSSIYILDKTKTPILSYGYEEGDIEAVPYVSTKDKSYVTNGGRNVIYDISSHNRWICAIAIPETEMFKSLMPMKIYFFLIMLIYAMSGAAIFIVALRSNRKTMQSLLKKLGIKDAADDVVSVDDIISSIEKLVANNQKLSERITGREEYLKKSVVLDVITGKTKDGPALMKEAGMEFNKKLFYVAVISIDDEGLLKSGELYGQNLARICVVNVFSEMLDSLCGYAMAETDEKHVAIILNPEDGEAFESAFCELCAQFKTLLAAEFEMSVDIAISQSEQGCESLDNLYNQARMALDYKTAPDKCVVFYEEVTDKKEHTAVYYYPSEVEEKIINCVCAGEEEALVEILEKLIEKNIKNSGIMRQSKNCFYYDLVGTYIKAADLIGYNSENTYKLVSKIDDDFVSVKHRVSMLCDEIIGLCRFSRKLQDADVDKTAERIKKYVEDNYSDMNLCVMSVADEFGLSRQTVSKKFSQAFDITLSDYITDVRLSKAKELLETTNLSGHHIAEMVGYVDGGTFIRAFKKQFSITPGQYKKNIMTHK